MSDVGVACDLADWDERFREWSFRYGPVTPEDEATLYQPAFHSTNTVADVKRRMRGGAR